MQEVLVIILLMAAITYLGFVLYKNFRGEAKCSSGCDCESPVVARYRASKKS